jgi:hypothetical protein
MNIQKSLYYIHNIIFESKVKNDFVIKPFLDLTNFYTIGFNRYYESLDADIGLSQKADP